jgi:hypothetical protein
MSIAEEAETSAEVPIGIWSALLQGLSSTHEPEEWASLLPILARLEPIYGSVLYELASLLKSSIDRKDGSLPRALFNEALAIANAAWNVCAASESPMPKEADNWVTVAINRTSSYLLDFYFGALWSLWQMREQEQPLIQSILRRLSDTIDGASPPSEVARILLAARAQLFAELDPGWYEARIVPLLETPASARSGQQCWDGYLVWGGWSQEMLPGLLPAYLSHLPNVITASAERSRMYCSHLAAIAVFGSIDPIENGWLDRLLIRARLRERLNWAREVTGTLREANQQTKDLAWERWLHRYLERRARSNPIPLDRTEAGAMCEWALVLQSQYTTIVELLLVETRPCVKRNMFYYRLHESAVLDQAPVITARFLTALLSQEDGNELWDMDQVNMMVERLIDLNPAEPALRGLCEELGRLVSPRALEFRNRLR